MNLTRVTSGQTELWRRPQQLPGGRRPSHQAPARHYGEAAGSRRFSYREASHAQPAAIALYTRGRAGVVYRRIQRPLKGTASPCSEEDGVLKAAQTPASPVDWLLDQIFFFSSRRRHTRFDCDWSSDVCSSD